MNRALLENPTVIRSFSLKLRDLTVISMYIDRQKLGMSEFIKLATAEYMVNHPPVDPEEEATE